MIGENNSIDLHIENPLLRWIWSLSVKDSGDRRQAECTKMDVGIQRLKMNTLQFVQQMKTGNAFKYLIKQLIYVVETQMKITLDYQEQPQQICICPYCIKDYFFIIYYQMKLNMKRTLTYLKLKFFFSLKVMF